MAKEQKVYKSHITKTTRMFPSDPHGSLDDFYYFDFGGFYGRNIGFY